MTVSKGNTLNLNVTNAERWISAVAGGALTVYGLTKKSKNSKGRFLMGAAGAYLIDRAIRGNCLMYRALGVNPSRKHQNGAVSVPQGEGLKFEKAIVIDRSPRELYDFWRNLENLPLFMKHLQSVEILSPLRSRWQAKAPGGSSVEWEAEIINDKPNELLAWRSLEDSQIQHAGSVEFKLSTSGKGTEIKVVMSYKPPMGKFGATIAKIFGEEPSQQIEDDLKSLKHLLESGEFSSTAFTREPSFKSM